MFKVENILYEGNQNNYLKLKKFLQKRRKKNWKIFVGWKSECFSEENQKDFLGENEKETLGWKDPSDKICSIKETHRSEI